MATIQTTLTGLTNGVEHGVRIYPRGPNGWQTDPEAKGVCTPRAIPWIEYDTGDKIQFGGLYKDGVVLPRPTQPWVPNALSGRTGNIERASSSLASSNYYIGNTPSENANKLQWIKIIDGPKHLFICDRCILCSVHAKELYDEGWLTGKNITIDGNRYLMRTMTGGVNYRISENMNSGAVPITNEWDRFVMNEDRNLKLPTPASIDIDKIWDDASKISPHNLFWNHWNQYTWSQDFFVNPSLNRLTVRGYTSAKYVDCQGTTYLGSDYGYRPVLELIL